jgi:DNA-binding MarR family transcriptional regulator
VSVEADSGSLAGAAQPAEPSLPRSAAWLAKQVEIGLSDLDLSCSQYRVLGLLDAGPAVSSALAERLLVRPPSVTAVVDGLVTKGLVDRGPIADDRRRVALTLTPAGRTLLGAADDAVNDRLGHIAAELPEPAQTQSAIDGLLLWQQAIRAYHANKNRAAATR